MVYTNVCVRINVIDEKLLGTNHLIFWEGGWVSCLGQIFFP